MSNLGGLAVTLPFNLSAASNQMNCSESTHYGQVGSSARVFFAVVHSLVFVAGLILNGFTLKVYFFRAQLRTSSSVTIYLRNLAAADFLISLCLPLRIIHYSSSSVAFHRAYCSFGSSAFYLNMYASILFMCYIAANRYLKIVHPLGTHILQTVRAAHVISVVTWVFLLTLMFTYVSLSLAMQEAPPSASSTLSCDSLFSKQLRVFYRVVHSICAAIFLLVLSLLFFFYYSTSRRLKLAQQRQLSSLGHKKLAKSRRNMMVLVIVFWVCFVPYHLVRLPQVFLGRRCSWGQTFFYLKEFAIILSVLNVCLDPLIYFLFCQAFRAQLSLRRVFGTTQVPTQVPTHGEHTEGRSSDGRMSAIRVNRKPSVSLTSKQMAVI